MRCRSSATGSSKPEQRLALHPSATGRSSAITMPSFYKERNPIERFFNKLKQFRRVATRYDKLLNNFMGFVKLAAIAIWLK
ncbi:MAG: hypothetical protein EOR50_33940 [Mesorhizobium sp.]|nr:MAG: hypothetical protein EOR50_33940 [Mesorhizobium sp.]